MLQIHRHEVRIKKILEPFSVDEVSNSCFHYPSSGVWYIINKGNMEKYCSCLTWNTKKKAGAEQCQAHEKIGLDIEVIF